MSTRHHLHAVIALLAIHAGACAATARSAPASPAASPAVHAVPVAVAAPARTGTSAARFAEPDQTVEYHFMIAVPAMTEGDLESSFGARIVEPLKAVADVGALGACKLGRYVDSKERGLSRHHLIVRVRDGQITIKARASTPAVLLDLQGCTSKKYEMDYFGTPDYSISSDVAFSPDEYDLTGPTPGIARLWELIERKCPGVWRQIRPAVTGSAGLVIPGVAHMYSAEATLKHASAAKLKEAGVAVWFFPPTDRFLVELAFTGFVKDRAEVDGMYAALRARLRAAGLLRADQSSKTRQYFAAYFGAGDQVRAGRRDRSGEARRSTARSGDRRARIAVHP